MSEVYSGNFASGQTDKVIAQTAKCAGPRTLLTGGGPTSWRTMKDPQCPPVISRAKGGSSGALLRSQMNTAAAAAAANNLAVAKLRQIPGFPIDANTRFVQYQRLPYMPIGPCPVSTINPAIPKAITEVCINVVGIVQTWPPH